MYFIVSMINLNVITDEFFGSSAFSLRDERWNSLCCAKFYWRPEYYGQHGVDTND